MSDSQSGSKVDTITYHLSDCSDHREIDIVDVISFLWRSRKIVVLAAAVGMVVSAVWLYVYRSESPQERTVTRVWSGRLGPLNGDEATLVFMPQQLSAFIKTTAGARQFYQTLARNSKVNIEELVNKQVAGQGVVKSFEITGADILVTLEHTGIFAEADLESLLPYALNQMIALFNKNYVTSHSKLMLQLQNSYIKLGDIKLRAIQLIERSRTVAGPLQKNFLEAILKDLTLTTRLETLISLLAIVPNHDEEKNAIISEFRKQTVAVEALQIQSRALAKSLGLELIAPMIPITPSIKGTISTSQTAVVKRWRFLEYLPALLIVGILFGAIIGIFIAILNMFLRKNEQRLKEIFRN